MAYGPDIVSKRGSKMTKTVIGTYRDLDSAVSVVNRLVDAGFHRNSISVIANDADEKYASYVDQDTNMDDTAKGAGFGAAIGGLGGLLLGLGALAIPGVGPVIAAGPLAAALAGAGIGAVTGGIIGALIDLGIPEESAHMYAESVRRGHVLVAAQVEDNRADEATRIMQHAGLIDIEREADTWRSSGWSNFDANANDTYTNGGRTERMNTKTTDRGSDRGSNGKHLRDDETIEVVEEELHVGKRAVETGGVRVTSHVEEVPVEEQVRLREEHVEIERRPVNRPATEADLSNFREGSIEVRETSEEAVIAKDARVVEEINVRKDVDERVETVRDSVRRTDVEVERLGGNGRQTMTGTAYETFDPDFRTHYQSAFSNMGNYDRFQPAYRYGYTLASDNRYQGRSWREVEPEARKAWDTQNQNSWEEFKDAVQYGWDRVRGKS
jgi:uncharacterized protein (TIGR02271 family)